MKTLAHALAAAAVALAPSLARAGWYAKQTHSTHGQPTKQTSELYYEDHKLRIDAPDQQMILDLTTGTMVLIDPARKSFATVTLDELLAARDQALDQMKARLSSLPKEVRAQVEQQIKAMEASAKADLDLKRTGRKDTINGFRCEVFSWTGPDGKGEACIASKLPVDTSGFQKDVEVLRSRLNDKGAGTGAASLALLQLAREGFPVRSRQSMIMGPSEVMSTAELTEIRAMKVPADKLQAPTGYAKRDFRELSGVPAPPPRGAQPPRKK